MISSLKNTEQEGKRIYQIPQLQQHTHWQPCIQTISLPVGVGVGAETFPSQDAYGLYTNERTFF